MTLVGTDENIIIFRGTTTDEEWTDNGQGGYSVETTNQADALEYVNSIELVNNNSFVVSGHSKGGNLAQYVTLFATDTLIDRCLSFDGQGFSNELYSTLRYKEAWERNGDKLYMIASELDYVNILFNSAVPEEHQMYIKANHEEGIHLYHKNNNILSYDENGMVNGFNPPVSISSFTYMLKDFVQYVMEKADIKSKQIVFDGIMKLVATVVDGGDLIDKNGPNSILDILADEVLPEIAKQDPKWIPVYLTAKRIDVTVDAVEMFESIIGLREKNGVLSEVLGTGTANVLLEYLGKYFLERPEKFIIGISSIISPDMENVMAGYLGIMNVSNIYAEIRATDRNSTTLGENYYGTEYRKVTEDGITVVRGTGKSWPVYGTDGDDYLHAGNGADIILAGDGDDVIFGGRGDDTLFGHAGGDTYVIGKYDGIDRIYDYSEENEANCIMFGAGIAEGDLEYEKSGNSLLIHYNPEHYKDCYVEVVNFFSMEKDGKLRPPIDVLVFKDGGEVYVEEILGKVGYEGTVEKTFLDKIAAKSEEEQEKILKEYGFLQEKIDKVREEASGNTEEVNQGTTGSSSRPDVSQTPDSSVAGSQNPGQEPELSPEEQAEVYMANIRNRVTDAENETVGKMPDKFTEATRNRYVDPVVVDLDRDGQFVTSLEDGVHFDLNGDGFAEKTAWVSRWDGLLVRDVNGNGSIDDGSELFGDQTLKKDGTVAKSGFEALAELDTNGDGILDSSDSEYDSLKIWMDFDRNGISNQNELFTLKEFGIISIDLGNKIISQMDQNGNLIKSQSIMGGGDTEFHINEYGFSVDYVDTRYRGPVNDTSGLPDGLPDIKGCGTLHSLAEEMVKNEKLLDLVTAYVKEQDCQAKSDMVEEILFVWTGADRVNPDSRGSRMDARKLHVVEQVYGQGFVGTSGPDPIVGAATILNGLYDSIREDVENRLLVQTVYQEVLESICITYNETTESFECDFSEILMMLAGKYSKQYAKWFVEDFLENTDAGACFDKEYIADQLKGKDTALGIFILADTVFAGSNMGETLGGTSGNDILDGGKGDDRLNGGYGDDTYLFSLGDGDDVVYDSGGNDRLVFGKGIKPEDLKLRRKGWDLHITNTKSGDHILVSSMYY